MKFELPRRHRKSFEAIAKKKIVENLNKEESLEVFEKIKAKALEDWYKLKSNKSVRVRGGTTAQAKDSYEIFNKPKNIHHKN